MKPFVKPKPKKKQSPTPSVKAAVMKMARALPDECTWDEAMSRFFLHRKIEAALKEAEQGVWISHEEVVEEFRQMKQASK